MSTDRYEALLTRLVTARRFGIVFGLDRIQAVLDRLGNPERQLGTIVHVGGTNGKGSTVAMIAALARASGRRVATYTSPHLNTLDERITIDGRPGELLDAADAVSAAGGDELTFFEQITAIGFLSIARARVDVSIIEVGLGGRLDATNVVAATVAVITGVAMDHEAILGDTLEKIAVEKLGIVKPGQHVVIGASGEPAVVALLAGTARAIAAGVTVVDAAMIDAVPPLGLVGAHQRANAAAAIAAAARLGIPIDPGALARVDHPGRFQQLGEGLILDGAHNPHGAAALAATLAARGQRPQLILAVSADKDAAAIVAALVPQCTRVVATRYQQDRAMDPAALAALIPGALVAPDLAAALAMVRPDEPILIAGSLFLVGEALHHFMGLFTDPIVASDPHLRR